jgi:hypothetical protein
MYIKPEPEKCDEVSTEYLSMILEKFGFYSG